MDLVHAGLIPALWSAWAVYWLVAARNVKTTRRRESVLSRLTHVVPLIAGCVLIASPWPRTDWLSTRYLPRTATDFWIGAFLVASGLAFAIWARRCLGDNWSGIVTLKHKHELIRTGPYRWARHPIYSGLLLALLGSAIAVGEGRGLIALALVTGALWRRIRIEERWLEEIFPEEYLRYRSEVSALIPFVF